MDSSKLRPRTSTAFAGFFFARPSFFFAGLPLWFLACTPTFEDQPALAIPLLEPDIQGCLADLEGLSVAEPSLCLAVEDAVCPLVGTWPATCLGGSCSPTEWNSHPECPSETGIQGVRFVHPESVPNTLSARLFVTEGDDCLPLTEEEASCFQADQGETAEHQGCLMEIRFKYDLTSAGELKPSAVRNTILKLPDLLTAQTMLSVADPNAFCPTISNHQYESPLGSPEPKPPPENTEPVPQQDPLLCETDRPMCAWESLCETSTTATSTTGADGPCIRHTLTPSFVFSHPDLRDVASFGEAMAYDGTHLVVGAPQGNQAVVFARDAHGWDEGTLLQGDAESERFGFSVDILNERIIVGSPGSNTAYVYRKENNVWTEETTLSGPDEPSLNGNALFGFSVALHATGALVGAPHVSSRLFGSAGVVLPFTRTSTSWSIQTALIPDQPERTKLFGKSLDASDQTLVVGASGENVSGASGAGALYVFEYDGARWKQHKRFVASDPIGLGALGERVQIAQDTIIASSPKPFHSSRLGEIYLFSKSAEGTTERTKVESPTDERSFSQRFFFSQGTLLASDISNLYVFAQDEKGWAEVLKLGSPNEEDVSIKPLSIVMVGDQIVSAGCATASRSCATDIHTWSLSRRVE